MSSPDHRDRSPVWPTHPGHSPHGPPRTAAPKPAPAQFAAIPPVATQIVTDSLQTVRVATEAAADAANSTANSAATEKLDERLDHVAGQLQNILVTLERLRGAIDSLAEDASDHEARLRRLEHWQQRMNPLLGLITFLLGLVASGTLHRLLP